MAQRTDARRTRKRVLVVEDDAALARVLRDNLGFEGFDVECAVSCSAALRLAAISPPNLVLLDVMLPDGDGLELCGTLRGSGRTPIIVLTARGQKTDKLRGLSCGADDYVTKPFDLEELLARVRAVLRRAYPEIEQLTLGQVVVDFARQEASGARGVIRLTRREFDILHYLAERRDRVVFRHELLREVWRYPDAPLTRSVDHAVARLRKKIEPDPRRPQFIHTAHGDGYCLTAEAPPAAQVPAGRARRSPEL